MWWLTNAAAWVACLLALCDRGSLPHSGTCKCHVHAHDSIAEQEAVVEALKLEEEAILYGECS